MKNYKHTNGNKLTHKIQKKKTSENEKAFSFVISQSALFSARRIDL